MRPTQRGHSSAVEQLLEKIELLRDVHRSEKQLAARKTVSNRDAKAQLRKRFSR